MLEFYGRQVIFAISYTCMVGFNCGAAVAPNVTILLVLRFLAGAFGSSPLTNAAGVIADMFTTNERGYAAALFATAPFLGPCLGPIIGGFIGQTEGGWRLVLWFIAGFTGVCWLAVLLIVPETYGPVLLRRRAALLSRLTGKVYISKLDAYETKTMGQQFQAALLRPWILLFLEPIVLITSIYLSILYGTLYLLVAAYPIVFQLGRGWGQGIGSLPFAGVAAGILIGVACLVLDGLRYRSAIVKFNGAPPPEARLPRASTDPLDPNRSLPIRVDQRPGVPLDHPRRRRRHLFSRACHCLLDPLYLPHRQLCHLRGIGHGRQQRDAVPIWSRLPVVHNVYVR